MSRYIPVALKAAAPHCEHCTPEDYHSIHHLIPYKLFPVHTENLIKVCRLCHIKLQFEHPKFVFASNLTRADCKICGHTWRTPSRSNLAKMDYNDNEFHGYFFCNACTNRWLHLIKIYKEHLK